MEKYYGFYNIETGTVDVRAYDPNNVADDPWYGRGDLWNGTGPWDTWAEAEAAADSGAATLRRLVIRKVGTSPAESENYVVIRNGDPIPEGWFVKAEFDTAADADRFIYQQIRWYRWISIRCDAEPLPPREAAEDAAHPKADEDLLIDNPFAQLRAGARNIKPRR